ncbi:MAG: EamA family transporter [Acidobacteriota bacterium]|nr:EamA family transporter [Acidobacteriota bacterium]
MSQQQTPQRWQVVLAFTLVYILWGSTYLAIRLAVDHMSPPMMGFLRFTTAGLLMLAYRAATGSRIWVDPRTLLRLTVIGVLLLVTSNMVVGWGEKYIPTGLAALFTAITPLWFLLLERLTHSDEHISWRGLAGIFLGVAGVAILLWPDLSGHTALNRGQLFGCALVLGASVSWASGSVLTKRWHLSVDPYTASGWQMLVAGLVGGLLAVGNGDLHHTTWQAGSLWAIGYLIVAGSLVGFTAYVWLLKNVPLAKVTTYAYVNPIVAVILGVLLHGEKLDGYMVAGAVVVILSVVLVTGAKVRHQESEEDAVELEPLEPAGD